jgi:TolB-like protein
MAASDHPSAREIRPATPFDSRLAVRQHRRRPGAGAFRDGATENLTTDLSRIRGSFIIGRNTAFSYKGKPVDLKQIGGERNVRYVLEGSVQGVKVPAIKASSRVAASDC